MGIFKIMSLSKDKKGNPKKLRTEYIDTTKHSLFKGVDSKAKVGDIYEDFHNLNPISDEKIKVLKVDRANILSKGGAWGLNVWKLNQVI
jgi:uncharacterized protein YnzC (UPF0291/DUF896 family)